MFEKKHILCKIYQFTKDSLIRKSSIDECASDCVNLIDFNQNLTSKILKFAPATVVHNSDGAYFRTIFKNLSVLNNFQTQQLFSG